MRNFYVKSKYKDIIMDGTIIGETEILKHQSGYETIARVKIAI